VPIAVPALEITGADGRLALMVMLNIFVPVPPALIALSVTLVVAAVLGVPEIRPVVVLTVSPAGNPVALKEVGLFEAVI
jgi:hypothetical protein